MRNNTGVPNNTIKNTIEKSLWCVFVKIAVMLVSIRRRQVAHVGLLMTTER